MTTPSLADEIAARYKVQPGAAPPRVLTGLVAALGPLLPAPAPHGPGAARQVAEQIAATGAVSCLIADGGHVCLGRPCDAPAPTLAEVLL